MVSYGVAGTLMSQLRDQLIFYLDALWRRRWIALAAAWVVCILGWIGIALMPNQYVAKTRIYVDTDTLLQPLLKGMAVDTNISRQVEIMQRTLLSRPNLQSVMRMTDLDLAVTSDEKRDDLLRDLERRTTVRSEGARNLFTIEFRDPNPNLAKNVIQSLLTIFIESQLGSSRRDMEKARLFLDAQLTQYERQLKDAEARLAAFKQEYQGMLPTTLGGDTNFVGLLDRKRTELAQLQGQLEDALARRAALTKQLAGIPRYIEVTPTGHAADSGVGRVPTELELRVTEAQRNLDQLRLKYTELHPDILAARRVLDQLKSEQAVAEKSNTETRRSTAFERRPNPVSEQLQLRHSELDADAESLQRRVNEATKTLAALNADAQIIPAIEQKYMDLNRDYGTIKKNYQEMLERRESARLSQEVDAKADKVQFRVIDPPTVPLTATFPNRPLLLSGVLFAGLGIGLVLALFLAQLDDSFGSTRQLRETFVFPVLGSITRVVNPIERRRQSIKQLSFIAGCLMLTGVYGAVVILSSMNWPSLEGIAFSKSIR